MRSSSLQDMLAEYTLLSMIVMVTPCLWYVAGMNLVCPMSKTPSFLKPLLHAPLLANPEGKTPPGKSKNKKNKEIETSKDWRVRAFGGIAKLC